MLSRVLARLPNASFRRAASTAVESVEASTSTSSRMWMLLAGALSATAAYLLSTRKSEASFGYIDDHVTPPKYPWGHKAAWKSFDHAAIRRGFEVYRVIGAACHSMKFIHYRQLVNVAYTEKEMKVIAAEYDDYKTEPDDEGEIHNREGNLQDKLWKPYQNAKEARAANNGALPPDLSVMVKARPHGEDYIFALLTGYRDPPHGIKLSENMYYNIYFPGCQIAMPPPLAPGAVDYSEWGIEEASISQMAKDVTVYLTWAAMMEHDERHLVGIKSIAALSLLLIPTFYWKRWRWNYVKHRSVDFIKPPK